MELISREQAVDALRGYLVEKRCPDDGTLTCRLIENEVINKLPPAQPKTNYSESPNTSDCISRQQAIDALRKMQTYKMFSGDDMLLIDQAGAQTELMLLPPIQPEPQYKTNYGFMWLCPKCGLPIHSDYTRCVRCGHNREKGV